MKKRIISLILSVLFLSIFYTGTINAAGEGSIIITFEYEIDQNGNRTSIAIPNATFSVYRVWSIDGGNNIILSEPFNSLLNANELKQMESEVLQKQAIKLEDRISLASPITSGTTNSEGILVINGLDLGGYLIVQNEPVVVNGEYYLAQSFLVTIPYKDLNHNVTTTVDIKPKASLLMSPEISKKVNDVDLYELKERNEPFVYTISTAFPMIPANGFRVTDKLESVLEFAQFSKPSEIVSITIDGNQMDESSIDLQVNIDKTNGVMVARFEEAQIENNAGKPVVISFKANVKKDALLDTYTNGRVPNEACYVAEYKTANRDSNSVHLNDFVYPALTPTQEKCSKKVFVYIQNPTVTPMPTPTGTDSPKTWIPNTFAYLMEQAEQRPWIVIVLVVLASVIAAKAYKSYNKIDRI